MAGPANIVGAALGVHALGLSLLQLLAPPPPPAEPVPMEVAVVSRAASTRADEPSASRPPAVRAPPTQTKSSRPRARKSSARRVTVSRAPSVTTSAPAPPSAVVEPAPTTPTTPAPEPEAGSDEAVLLSALGQASRNGAALDGDGESSAAARASDFVRGATRGATTPAHESRAAPAAPVEDYTRLLPTYTSASILHDVSASVAVRVEVDEHGRVVDVRVLKGAGYGLDEVALEMVRKYRFKPALDDEGRPVRSAFGWRIVWPSHWRRLMLDSVYGRPNCRGQGPLNLGSVHPVYIDCDGPPGYFDLEASPSSTGAP